MIRRVLFAMLATTALAGAALVSWLPTDLSPRAEAQSEPEPPSSENKLLASEAAFFVTFRPADFTSDELLKTALMGMDKEMERSFHVSLSDADRVTFAFVAGGNVTILHTRKAYDKDKLKEAFTTDRYGFKEKFADKDGPRKPEVVEKKVGGKTIYHAGPFGRYTQGFCAIDKTTFAFGEVPALQAFFEGKNKASASMSAAVALSGKHSLVFALDGKRVGAAMKREREERDRSRREQEKRFEKQRFEDKKINFREEKKEKAKDDKAKDEKDNEGDFDDLFNDAPAGAALMILPYRPLLKAKFCLLTFDAKKTYTLKATVTANGKEDQEDVELALRMGLMVLRDYAVVLPKHERGEMKHLAPLSAPVAKAFKQAKVERKGDVFSTTVTMTPDDSLVKKMKEAAEEQKKSREPEFKDKPRSTPKEK